MQITINVPDNLPHEEILKQVRELKDNLTKKAESLEKSQKTTDNNDPWDNLDIEEIAVDTGIEDFAENHDHYLYGTPKRS